MKKRRIALVLAAILMFQTGAEPVLAAGELRGEPQVQTSQEENVHTVSFETGGGTVIPPMEVADGEMLDEAEIPPVERTGYIFEGWKQGEEDYHFSEEVYTDLVLTAKWTPITYRVQFDANGGEGEPIPEQIHTYDTDTLLPSCSYTRNGYLFGGWSQDNGASYAAGASVRNLSDQKDALIVLRAVWIPGSYTIQFSANGGEGSMMNLALSYDETQILPKNGFKREGYTFSGWNTLPDGSGVAYQSGQAVKSLTDKLGGEFILYAMWEGNPYQVSYDGNGASQGAVENSSHIYGTKSRLNRNQFQREGYTFGGWTTKANGKGKSYEDEAEVTNLTKVKDKTVILYAKWIPISYGITYHTNGGKFKGTYRKTYNIETKTFTYPKPTRKGYDFDGWYRDASCKKRVDTVKQGSMGEITVYAKWVKCSTKAKKNSAKITSCKSTGTGKVKVKATIKKRVASSDDYYYLVYVSPTTKKPYKMAARTYKKKKITFKLKTAENQGYVTSFYVIAVKKNGKYQPLCASTYVKNPKKAAKNKSGYRLGQTKKGIQYSNSVEELYSCGAKNTFLNVTASMVCNGGTVPYVYNGKTYYFNDMASYQQIVSACNRRRINVTMQILLDWTDGQTDMIAAKARVAGAAPFYTWNISNNKSREKMEAMFCYLGQVFGKKDCYTSNWILGNEVNNPNGWNYAGGMSKTAYFRTYAYGFRSLYYAVKSQYSSAKIFICVDNLWNTAAPGGYSAKTVISSFTKELNRLQKGLQWNLAYHAYSFPLTNTLFWNDRGITYDENSPYITMRNLNELTKYIKKKYGSSVRIILSEQGYTSSSGQSNQAAAIAYSYYIAACNPMIDSFIIRSYSDHPVEVAQGLSMGIAGKEAFQVFRYMDTGKSGKYTRRYLGVIGADSWKQIVPGYSKKRLRKMYRKA